MAKGDRTGNRKTREQRRTFFCRFFGGFVFFVGEFSEAVFKAFTIRKTTRAIIKKLITAVKNFP